MTDCLKVFVKGLEPVIMRHHTAHPFPHALLQIQFGPVCRLGHAHEVPSGFMVGSYPVSTSGTSSTRHYCTVSGGWRRNENQLVRFGSSRQQSLQLGLIHGMYPAANRLLVTVQPLSHLGASLPSEPPRDAVIRLVQPDIARLAKCRPYLLLTDRWMAAVPQVQTLPSLASARLYELGLKKPNYFARIILVDYCRLAGCP
jgi:hypothetical protein